MSIDTRLKRQSATCILCPFMLSGVYGDTAGISDKERPAVVWVLVASILRLDIQDMY